MAHKNIFVGIYRLYWETNDYFYYGQSSHIKHRVNGHINCLKKNKHQNKILSDVVKKYGPPKYEIVVECDKSQLDFYEQKYLDQSKGNKKCCNVVWTASSLRGHKMPPRSAETRRKLSEALKGRVFSSETLEKMRIGSLGKRMSEENKLGNTYRRGVKLSDETKRRCSVSQQLNVENKIRIASFNEKRKKPAGQINPIKNVIINKFNSIAEANMVTKVDRKSIILCCKNKSKLAGGFVWIYL